MREAVEGPVKETEQIRISSNLRDNEVYIRKQCENCADILVRSMRLGEDRKVDCLMVYIEVTVSNMMLDDSAIGKMINHFWEIPEEKIRNFYGLCRNLRLHITESNPYENAQVSAGGVDVREVKPTMESKICSGVYFAGEILDVDGRCGGYNLQWAWSSGYLAGYHAALG